MQGDVTAGTFVTAVAAVGSRETQASEPDKRPLGSAETQSQRPLVPAYDAGLRAVFYSTWFSKINPVPQISHASYLK